MLIRWNDDPSKPRGNPVSHGHPTWFVLPFEFYQAAFIQVRSANPAVAQLAEDWLENIGPDHWPYDPAEFPGVK